MLHNNKLRYIYIPVVVLLASVVTAGIVSLLGVRPGVEAADRQQWEYMTVHYSQFDTGDENPTEYVFSNDPAYD